MGFEFKSKSTKLQKQAKYAPAKRHTTKWQWYLLILILVSPIIYFAYKLVSENFIPKAEGHIVFRKIEIRSPSPGYIGKIFVQQGDVIKKNQSLISFDYPEKEKKRSYLEKEIKYLGDKIKFTENPELKKLLEMEKEAESYETELTYNYKQLQKLSAKKLATFMELQRSRVDLNEARIQVHDIGKKMKESNYNHELKMEYYYGRRMRELESELEALQEELELTKIKSPADGTVVSLNIREKEYVTANKDLMEIATDKDMHIRAYLPSKFLSKGINEGTQVSVIFSNGLKKQGKIYKIQPLAEKQPNTQNVIKKIKNRVVLLIRLTEKIPKQYQIYGFPVEISFPLF